MSLKYLYITLLLFCIGGMAFIVYNLWIKGKDVASCIGNSHCPSIAEAKQPRATYSKQRCHATCQTKDCVLTAAQMYDFMDESVSPCDDFYHFACGNYLRENNPEGNDPAAMVMIDTWRELFFDVKKIIENFPNKQKPVGVSYSSFSKLKKTFEVCMEHQALGKSSAKDILEVLSDYGLQGWPDLEGDEWRFPDGSADKFLSVFHTVNIGTFVNIFSYVDTHNVTNSTGLELILEKGSLLIWHEETYLNTNDTENEELQKLKATIENVFELFEVPTQQAKKMSMEIIQLDIQLATFFKQWDEKSKENRSIITKHAFEPASSKWYDIIRYYVNALGIEENFYPEVTLTIEEKMLLEELKDRIDRVPHRILANYMVFKLIERYKLYTDFFFEKALSLSYEFVSKTLSFILGLSKCIVLVASTFKEVVAPVYMALHFNKTAFQKFNKVFDVMVGATSNLIHDMTWMTDENLKITLKSKLHNLLISTKEIPDRVTDYEKIDQMYQKLLIHEHNLFGNVLMQIKHLKGFELQKSLEGKKQSIGDLTFDVSAGYTDHYGGRIYVGLGILKLPFFAVNRPDYANFAGIGIILAHEMGHAIFKTLECFNGSREVMQAWENKKSCIVSHYSKYFYDSVDAYVQGNVTVVEDLPDHIGINAAHRVYQEYERKGIEPRLIPVHGFKDKELFFISASQVFCESVTPKGLLAYSEDIHSSGNVRVLGLFSNMLEFSKAFKCPLNSVMNPITKCNVLN